MSCNRQQITRKETDVEFGQLFQESIDAHALYQSVQFTDARPRFDHIVRRRQVGDWNPIRRGSERWSLSCATFRCRNAGIGFNDRRRASVNHTTNSAAAKSQTPRHFRRRKTIARAQFRNETYGGCQRNAKSTKHRRRSLPVFHAVAGPRQDNWRLTS